MTDVLTAVGAVWEGQVVTLVEGCRRLRLVRRCADLADLLAVAAAGLGQVALVTADLRGLGLTSVDELHSLGLTVLALEPTGKEAADRRLLSIGVDAVLPLDCRPAELEERLATRSGDPDERATVPARPVGPIGTDGLDAPSAGGSPAMPSESDGPRGSDGPPGAQEPPGPLERPAGRVIAVWGPTGAPGRTTVAVNLAAEIAAAGRPVLLVDLDTYGAAVAQVLSLLDEAPGVVAACRAAEQGDLDVPTLQRLSPLAAPGLRVLTGIPRADRWGELRPAAVDRLIEVARLLVPVVVVDVGFCLEDDEELSYDTMAPRRNAVTRTALAAADEVLAVGAGDPVGLQRLVRGLGELAALGVSGPTVVVTKVRASATGPSPRTTVADTVRRFAGVETVTLLPDGRDVLDPALLAGRTLVEAAPASPLRRELAALAGRLTELPAPARRWSRRGTMGR